MPPRRRIVSAAAIAFIAGFLLAGTARAAGDPAFAAWVTALRQEALAKGISGATFDRAFANVAPLPRVLELDRRQPEFTQTFWSYLDRRATPERVATGKQMLSKHGALLRRVAGQ